MISPLRRATIIGADRVAASSAATCVSRTGRRGSGAAASPGRCAARPRSRATASWSSRPNCHRFLELYQAVPGAGPSASCPLNPRHTPAELRYASRTPAPGCCSPASATSASARISSSTSIDLDDGYEALLAAADPVELPTGTVGDDDLAGLFYTGGTTGAVEGRDADPPQPGRQHDALHGMLALTPDTRWLIIAPLFHAAGSIAVLATLWSASTQVMLPRPSIRPGARPDRAEHGVTQRSSCRRCSRRWSRSSSPARDVTSLGYIATAARRSRPRCCASPHAFPRAEFVHVYGATETSPLATLCATRSGCSTRRGRVVRAARGRCGRRGPQRRRPAAETARSARCTAGRT